MDAPVTLGEIQRMNTELENAIEKIEKLLSYEPPVETPEEAAFRELCHNPPSLCHSVINASQFYDTLRRWEKAYLRHIRG